MDDRLTRPPSEGAAGENRPQPGERRLAAGIFFLALAVYVLTYVGAFKSNDERALFSGIDSFVKRGEFTVNQIYWDYTHVGMRTTTGDMVPNYEPAQMVVATPFYLWGRVLGAAVQGVMFFGAVVMAAAAALIYLCLLELGYRRRSSVLGAFAFAFATMAWPYSRTFFREPLTVLMYLLAFYGLLRYRPPAPRRLFWPALTGTALGLAITTKQISVAIIPSLLLLAVVYEWQRPSKRSATGGDRPSWLRPEKHGTFDHAGQRTGRIGAAAAAIVPLAIILLLGRLYDQTTLGGVTVFARDIVDYTTNPQLSQSVPIRMVRAALGLTVSPYKGLFWYSPVLLLGLVGAIPFLKRHLWEGLAFLMVLGVHLLGYSRYNYWSGGVAWGSRYMLPVVPFLILLAAPVWEWLAGEGPVPSWPKNSRAVGLALRVLTVLLIALSACIQVLGVSVDLRTYELQFLLDQAKIWGGIGQAIEALYMNPSYSPVLGHLRLLLSGTQPLDFAWVQWRPQGTWAFVPVGLLLSAILVGLALLGLVVLWRWPSRVGDVVRPRAAADSSMARDLGVGIALGIATVVVCSSLLTIYRHGDGRFDPYGVDRFLKPMAEDLTGIPCQPSTPLARSICNDALVVPDPVLTDYFLNYLQASLVWYGLEPRPVDQALLQTLMARYGRIWLARDRSAQADDTEDRRGWERYLTEHAYKVDEQRYGDWARLLSFSAAGRPAEESTPQQGLGELVLQSSHLGIEGETTSSPHPGPYEAGQPADPLDDGKVQAHMGDTLQIGLRWQATQKPAANYSVFVQLLDAASQVKAQRDRWPGDGLFPTGALSAGQVITDNLALPLDVPPGQYRLITGLYRNDVEGLPRLTGPGGDTVTLAQVDVHPRADR